MLTKLSCLGIGLLQLPFQSLAELKIVKSSEYMNFFANVIGKVAFVNVEDKRTVAIIDS